MAISRPSGAAANGGGSKPLVGGDAARDFPSVWEWLSSEQYDDGSARQTATLLVFVEEGRVKLCLNDRDGHRKAWVSGSDPLEAFLSLEQCLSTGAVDWRSDAKKGPSRGR